MFLNYAMCNISVGSLFTPIGEQRVNIRFHVKLGKSATETYSQCLVMKCYHVHVCLNGKCFHEGWETTENDGRSGGVFLRKFRQVQILLATKSSNYHPNVILAEHSKMACHEILCEDLGNRKLNADSCKSKRKIVLQLCQPFGNCKQN